MYIENAGTASTGFCVISADNCDVEQLHTQQIYNKKNAAKGEDTKLTFKMKVTNDAEVTFYAHWGTSSHYDEFKDKGKDNKFYIIQGETVELKIDGAEKDEDADTKSEQDQSGKQNEEQSEEQSGASGNEQQSQGADADNSGEQSDDLEVKATSEPESSLEEEDASAIDATPKPM